MNKIIKAMAVTGVALMSVSSVAFAAPLDDVRSAKVFQKVKNGAITLKAPGTWNEELDRYEISLPDVTVSSQVESTSVVAPDFRVDDARGAKTPAGWTATVTMSKLASVADPTTNIPFVDPITTHNDYTLTMEELDAYNGASLTGVSLGASGTAQELLENGSTGTSLPVTVMSATAGNGKGQFSSNIKIDLKVPANSVAADDYTSTLTFTVS